MASRAIPVVTFFARHLADLRQGLPGTYWFLLLGTFVTKIGTFVVPLLFVYLTQTRKLSLSLAGAIVSLYGLGSLVGTLLGGACADRFGRRKTMLASLVAGAAFMLLLGAVSDVWKIALVTLALSVTADAYRPASQALVVDVVAPAHRSKAFALQYWAVNLGFSCAAIIGGWFATRNFGVLFVADAATTLALATIVFWFIPSDNSALVRGSRESEGVSEPSVEGSWLTPFVDPRFWPLLCVNFLITVVFFQHLTGLPEQMRVRGLSASDFGRVLAANGLFVVVLQPVALRVLGSVPRYSILSWAGVLTGLGFGFTAFANSMPAFTLAVFVWTLGEVLWAPVCASAVADAASPHLRGRYQAAFGLTFGLAMVFSSALGPWFVERTSLNALWAVCLAVGLVVACAARLMGKSE